MKGGGCCDIKVDFVCCLAVSNCFTGFFVMFDFRQRFRLQGATWQPHWWKGHLLSGVLEVVTEFQRRSAKDSESSGWSLQRNRRVHVN